jgi:hypothetical protein
MSRRRPFAESGTVIAWRAPAVSAMSSPGALLDGRHLPWSHTEGLPSQLWHEYRDSSRVPTTRRQPTALDDTIADAADLPMGVAQLVADYADPLNSCRRLYIPLNRQATGLFNVAVERGAANTITVTVTGPIPVDPFTFVDDFVGETTVDVVFHLTEFDEEHRHHAGFAQVSHTDDGHFIVIAAVLDPMQTVPWTLSTTLSSFVRERCNSFASFYIHLCI